MKQFLLPLCVLVALTSLQSCKSKFPFSKEWELTELNGQQVPAGTRITIVFDQNNTRYRGSASCNNYNGQFTLKGKSLSLGNGAATKKMCPNMEWEDKYLPVLSKIDGWKVADNQLHLTSGGSVVASYK
ncbi:MAG: META domain-containing protein [Saprospiraceae bacterium]|nr:META domain-containing protein [Saprospiraceae bacterium]